MKLIFLASSFTIIYWMRFHKVIRVTYDREHDTFKYQFLVLPCFGLACILNSAFTPMEVRKGGRQTRGRPCCSSQNHAFTRTHVRVCVVRHESSRREQSKPRRTRT